MQQNLAKDDQVNQRIADYYQRAIDEINQTIDANARLLVDEHGNQTGYQTVSKEQMEAYQREAKAVVDQADQMRANGHRPTYDDFPTEVNRRMRVYNATMRINRLELLKSRLGTILLPATMQTDWDLQDRLSGDYIAECKRQAGIMEVTARPTMWTQTKVAKIVMAQTGGATFSQRLWANQDALKARLDQVVANGIIQGQNPREMARRLKSQVRDTIVNQRYVTERIARTESARVQFTAQLDSIKANGYQYVQWFAEIRACSECKAIANRNNGYGPGIYKVDEVPKIPEDTHPNCRCSISETWVDGRDDNLKDAFNNGQLLNRFSNEAFNKSLGSEVAQQFAKGLASAPKPLQKMYIKFAQYFKADFVGDVKDQDCFYLPRTKAVTLDTSTINFNRADPDLKPVDVVYHELGHLIDDQALNGQKLGRSSVSASSDLGSLLDNDWRAYNEKLGSEINNKTDLEKSKIYTDFTGQEFYGGYEGYGGVKLTYKKDNTFTVATKRRLGEQLHFEQLKSAISANGWIGYSDVSDMVEAATRGRRKLGYGHGSRYWMIHGMQEKEFFAECSSATINNPESLKVIKEHFPNAYKRYLELVNQINSKEV